MYSLSQSRLRNKKKLSQRGQQFWPPDSSKNVVSVRWELAKRNDFCSGGKELEKAKVCLCELLRSSESSLASFCQLRVTIQVGSDDNNTAFIS